ncbi:regulatory protein [Sinobaca qinghaiensis]|uniref:Regulatory protein RecX n=1 Tax=Sinobaca qinghaiensis TaxID=342944 RepID=A0A419UZF1_9BACL|nr:recombination regulator RecX [Sinobaca qinghaiensis]RKD71054.1 regulatory protein [Sinobaca qinghaiensis]
MKVAKITTQQKNSQRYNIFSEEQGKDKYAFSVDESAIVEFGLKKGLELSDTELEAIEAFDQKRRAWNAVLHYLSFSMRTKWQVEQYLLEKEYAPAAVEEAVNRALDYKFLDDAAFAEAFVRTKINTTDKGPKIITGDLRQKGIGPDLAEKALLQFTKERQIDKGVKIIQKKADRQKDAHTIFKKKMMDALRQKGYDTEIFTIAWEEAAIVPDEEEEWERLEAHGDKILRKWEKKAEGRTLQQKVKEQLYRKGFNMQLIQRFLDQKVSGE